MSDDGESQPFDTVKDLKCSGMAGISHAIEVLLKKASVDAEFRKLLLDRRAEAAREIELELTDAERDMLACMPRDQLEKIIANTKVPIEHRSVFLGTAGMVMLAVVTGVVIGSFFMPTLGHTLSPQQREMVRRMQEDMTRITADANDANEPPRDDQLTTP